MRWIVSWVLVSALGCAFVAPARAERDEKAQESLLIGYDLLAQYLDAEAHLRYLSWLRELTLQGTAKEIERIMTEIYEGSSQRSDELEKLRTLSPRATAKPPPSPIGSAIQSAAQWDGTKDLLFPDGRFGMRFVVLQAQGTRMLAVIAQETAKIDPNDERKKWLEAVARQFNGLREQLLKAVEGCEPR